MENTVPIENVNCSVTVSTETKNGDNEKSTSSGSSLSVKFANPFHQSEISKVVLKEIFSSRIERPGIVSRKESTKMEDLIHNRVQSF